MLERQSEREREREDSVGDSRRVARVKRSFGTGFAAESEFGSLRDSIKWFEGHCLLLLVVAATTTTAAAAAAAIGQAKRDLLCLVVVLMMMNASALFK